MGDAPKRSRLWADIIGHTDSTRERQYVFNTPEQLVPALSSAQGVVPNPETPKTPASQITDTRELERNSTDTHHSHASDSASIVARATVSSKDGVPKSGVKSSLAAQSLKRKKVVHGELANISTLRPYGEASLIVPKRRSLT